MKLARRLRLFSVLAAAFAIAAALASLTLEASPTALGPGRPLTGPTGYQWNPVTDGRFVAFQEADREPECTDHGLPVPPLCVYAPNRRIIVDLATGQARNVEDDIWRLGYFDPLVVADGTVASRTRLYDLENGTARDAPWNGSFLPEARAGSLVFGATSAGYAWHDLATGGEGLVAWMPDGERPGGVHLAAATRDRLLVAWQPNASTDRVAVALVDVATGNETRLTLGEREGFAPLRPHPWGVAGALNATRAMVAVARENATPFARFFDAATGEAAGEAALPPVPFTSATSAGDRWVVALATGHVSGRFDGTDLRHVGVGRDAVALDGDGGVVYVNGDERVWRAGAGDAEPFSVSSLDVRRLTLATAAVAAAGVSAGLGWAARRADRVAVAAGARCGGCGAPRSSDLAFCAACGAD
ncbi:MAG TPA: hypothetical protein VM889_13015 [Candidatus Thermoplasmatota archaeon]|nr:hypothetical protein [Candidatus Thermoplasmatota archaeon]